MALIDELKEKLKDVETYISARHAQIREHGSAVEELERQRWDLDLAIAALTPTPDFEAEKATAREQLEREPEIPEEGLGASLIAMGYGDDDTPAEHISILTGDPAIEPESGLHEEAPALNEAMHDEREEAVALVQPEWNEPQPTEGYAPVTNPEADALARAHDYYDPKAVADRERNAGLARLFAYNPFYKPKVDA